MGIQFTEIRTVLSVQFKEDVDGKHGDEPNVGEVDCTRSREPRILHRSLFSTAKEGRQSEDTHWNSGESGAPPCGVPREHGLADDVADEPCWHHKLRQVFTPPEVAIGKQHVPVGEHESCLSIRISGAVEWWWNQPSVKQQNREH